MIDRAELPVQRNSTLYWPCIRLLLRSGSDRSAAARLAASRLRLGRPNKGAHEPPIHLRSEGTHIHTSLGKELARVFDVVHAGRLDRNVVEPGFSQLGKVFTFLQSAGDAA